MGLGEAQRSETVQHTSASRGISLPNYLFLVINGTETTMHAGLRNEVLSSHTLSISLCISKSLLQLVKLPFFYGNDFVYRSNEAYSNQRYGCAEDNLGLSLQSYEHTLKLCCNIICSE